MVGVAADEYAAVKEDGVSEPRAEAGRRLLKGRSHMEQSINGCVLCERRRSEHVWVSLDDILVIEAEASAPSPETLALVEAVRFRASTTFTSLDPQPTGPDLLMAIAAYMDRQDDAAEARGDVEVADRTVQADVRRWAIDFRVALDAWLAKADEGAK